MEGLLLRADEIDTICTLSPAQEGLLFHSLADPASEMYIEQGVCALTGDLDPEAFQAAWQFLADRHDALRTAFFWKGLSKPVQVVYKKTAVPFCRKDLADRSAAERRQAMAEQMKSDRASLSALDQAPLMRLALFRLDRDRWEALWSIHHLIHDAWSLSVMLREVLTAYESFRAGVRPTLLPAGSYLDYVKWLKKNGNSGNHIQAERFWRRHLSGFQDPTPLPYENSGSATSHSYNTLSSALDEQLAAALTAEFRQRQVTLNTLFLSAWAMVLGFNARRAEVVFGAVTSGRPVDLPGVDRMAGLFIRTLPFRVVTQLDMALPEWLAAIQEQQLRLIEYEQTPLSQIRKWSELPAGLSLFESLVVYQSAFEGITGLTTGGLAIREVRSEGHPHYPLMFRVTPGRSIQLEIVHDTHRLSVSHADKLLRQAASIVREMALRPTGRVEDFRRHLEKLESEEEDRQKSRRRTQFSQSFGRMKPLPISSQVAAVHSNVVSETILRATGTSIAVLEPRSGSPDLSAWASDNLALLETRLAQYGGLLFRNFKVASASEFQRFIETVAGRPMEYLERSSPRKTVHEQIYSSTEYPADQSIFLHNENSYARSWPLRIFFYCEVPPTAGGETPLADVRSVYQRITPEIKERFRAKGVLYVRHFSPYLGMPWEVAFQSSDRLAVEQYCASAGYDTSWIEGDLLRTRRIGQAIANHPQTGEEVWFNHATFFHVNTLPDALAQGLITQLGEDRLPYQTFYGDGSPIEPETLAHLRECYEAAKLAFPWRRGDVLMLDNMLVAHGRAPFKGPRRILVGMANPFEYHQLQS
jgi:alpha-ketoglutarate-dependent taurine dioxygenase